MKVGRVKKMRSVKICTHVHTIGYSSFQPDIDNESSLVEPGMIFAWFRALSSAEKFECRGIVSTMSR